MIKVWKRGVVLSKAFAFKYIYIYTLGRLGVLFADPRKPRLRKWCLIGCHRHRPFLGRKFPPPGGRGFRAVGREFLTLAISGLAMILFREAFSCKVLGQWENMPITQPTLVAPVTTMHVK